MVALLALWWTPGALAADVDPFEEADESALFATEERLVTVASRYAQTVDQAPSIVTVITDQQIRSRGFRTVSDALRSLPGVYISVAPESRDLAWFRGVVSPDNNKFLLLVDGVPWYDGVYTHAFIDEFLTLANVKQIEVIKGPGSAIYGTNAFSGVVNVVTYGADDLQGGFARAETGSWGHRNMAAVYAERVEALGGAEVRAVVRFLDVDGDGLDVTPRGRRDINGLDPKRTVHAGFGLKTGGFTARVDHVDYRHTYFVNEQDDALDVYLQSADEFNLRYHDTYLHLRYDVELGGLGRLSPYFYAQLHDNPGSYAWIDGVDVETTDNGDGTSSGSGSFSTTLVETEKTSARYGTGAETQLILGPDHTTIAGLGAEIVQVIQLEDIYFVDQSHDPETPSPFTAPEGFIWDAFAFGQHTWTATWWLELTGGLRLDQHQYFGTFVSPRAGVLLLPEGAPVVKVLYGRAFRAPTARELLVQVTQDSDGSNAFTSGNPDLQPEVIDTAELEISRNLDLPDDGVLDRMRVQGAAFVSTIDGEITKIGVDVARADPELGDLYYLNSGGSTVVGLEAQGVAAAGPVEASLSYAYTQATDRDTGFAQHEFPPHMGHARLTLAPVDALRVSGLVDAYGTRPRAEWSPDAGLEDGPSFALVHASVATDGLAAGKLRADLTVRNLLGTEYTTLSSVEDANATNSDGTAKYPSDLEGEGRSVVVGIEYAF